MSLIQPWWVTLFALVPPALLWAWRRRGIGLGTRVLGTTALLAVAFGYIEAVTVVYLRASIGLAGNALGLAPSAVAAETLAGQIQVLRSLPHALLAIEATREAATIVLLLAAALIAARSARARAAAFLWMFALWDLTYYLGLWLVLRWPENPTAPDVLFLLPVPWIAPVWFALAVNAALAGVVLYATSRGRSAPVQSA